MDSTETDSSHRKRRRFSLRNSEGMVQILGDSDRSREEEEYIYILLLR